MTKLFILQEIKRTTEANGGRPLPKNSFEARTGIRRYEWFGVYWARWSDALREAGCLPQDLPVSAGHHTLNLLRSRRQRPLSVSSHA